MSLTQKSSYMEDGEYNIIVDKSAKEFKISFDGKFTDKDGEQAFVNAFTAKLNAIDPTEYIFVIDVEKLTIFDQDIIEQVTNVFKFYKSCNFKLIRFVLGNGPVITKIQMKRIAGLAELDNYEFA